MKLFVKAEQVGLGGVYRVAYPFLSAYAHPTSRPFVDLFELAESRHVARIPERNVEEESVLALWAFWFELRILTLASREYGVDLEHVSDDFISMDAGGPNFRDAVVVREDLELR